MTKAEKMRIVETTGRLEGPATEKIKEAQQQVPSDKLLKIAYELLDLSLGILKYKAEQGSKRGREE